MLSYSQTYGMGAALLRRPVFSGAARADAGVVVAQVDPYLARDKPGFALESIAHNGAVYIGIGANTLYTSPDLVTFTARYFGGASQYASCCTLGASLFAIGVSSPNLGFMSTDNGASWVQFNSGYNSLAASGGVGFSFLSGSSTQIQTFTSAGVTTGRVLTKSSQWNKVLYAGNNFLLLNQDCSLGQISADAVVFRESAGLAQAQGGLLVSANRRAYTVGGRFVIVAFDGVALSSIYSDDGDAWHPGARQVSVAGVRPLAALHKDAVELDGHLYVSATAAGGAAGLILSTADGISWRAHTDYFNIPGANISAPGLYKLADGRSFAFNGGGAGAGPALQSNPDALELYYEL